jgi:hypothetical protein
MATSAAKFRLGPHSTIPLGRLDDKKHSLHEGIPYLVRRRHQGYILHGPYSSAQEVAYPRSSLAIRKLPHDKMSARQ